MASATLPSSQRRIVVENGSIKSPYLCAKIYSDPVQVWFDASILILQFRLFRQTRRLHSVTFESNSRLTRIESRAFSLSSLQSIVILRGVRFLDGSAFRNVKLSSISIENENERFVIQNDCLIDIVDHKLIRNLSISLSVTIPCNIDLFCSSCFSYCESLNFISFEFNSRLIRIESELDSYSAVESIVIPRKIEILCSGCFSWCKSLHSVTFESNSRLIRIESRAFSHSSHQSISEHLLGVTSEQCSRGPRRVHATDHRRARADQGHHGDRDRINSHALPLGDCSPTWITALPGQDHSNSGVVRKECPSPSISTLISMSASSHARDVERSIW
jgi:hypothetical protein